MPHRRRQSDNDVIVQEIDDFITENSLEPIEKLLLRVMKHNYINSAEFCKHIENKDYHTPKGLLVRTSVIGWAIFIMIIISTVVAYLPEQVAMLTP